MASTEVDLVAMLKASSGVTAYTSTTRIYPARLPPEATVPAGKGAILYTLLAGASTNTTFAADSGLVSSVYQLDILTNTHADAVGLREAVRTALVGKAYGSIRKVIRANLAITVWERDINMWRTIFDVQILGESGT